MKKLLLLVCILLRLAARAQYNDMGYFRKAEILFEQKDYYAAAQYYQKYLTVDKKAKPRAIPFALEKKHHLQTALNPRQQAILHLAMAYYADHDYVQAEKYAKLASEFDANAYPEARYWYGKALLGNGRYEEANEAFLQFENKYTTIGPILQDADRQLNNLRFIQSEMKKGARPAFALTRHAPVGGTSAYAMSAWGEDSLVYTLIHTDRQLGYKNDLFLAGRAAINLDDTLLHNGLSSFSADGRKMFFTRWSRANGVTRSAIWSRQLSDSGWSKSVPLSSPVNIAGSNSTQPFISADSKYLLFASDRVGGQGGYDIYIATLDTAGKILLVNNAGVQVNTPGNEAAPYYHQKSNTLVFASDGRVGMGGYDIYYTRGYLNLSQFEVPRNPGVPVNSSKDDLYFISTDEDNCWNTGWLSSDRDSGCCLVNYQLRQNNKQHIAGKVIDCRTQQPLRDVTLTLKGGRNFQIPLGSIRTDSAGAYQIEFKNTSRFQLRIEKDGYVGADQNYTVHMETGDDTLYNQPICLSVPPAVDSQLRALSRSNVLGNWPYKRSSLPVEALHSLDSLAAFMAAHPDVKIEVQGYTDGIGGEQYNIRLAQRRVDACIKYLIKQGVAAERLSGRSFGRCCPIAPETIDGKDNPPGRQVNRRVEYKVINERR